MTYVIDRTCIRCRGNGVETFWDSEWESHVCYHCSGSGRVDEDMAFHDSLQQVAYTLAYNEVSSLRNARNENPDGEDWDFCAAENMMSGWDYFREEVYNRIPAYLDRLIEMSRESQEVLIAWNNLPVSQTAPRVNNNPVSTDPNAWECPQESDIPF